MAATFIAAKAGRSGGRPGGSDSIVTRLASNRRMKGENMSQKELWEQLAKVSMSIDAQRALQAQRQFALAGQWSRRAKLSSERKMERLEAERRWEGR